MGNIYLAKRQVLVIKIITSILFLFNIFTLSWSEQKLVTPQVSKELAVHAFIRVSDFLYPRLMVIKGQEETYLKYVVTDEAVANQAQQDAEFAKKARVIPDSAIRIFALAETFLEEVKNSIQVSNKELRELYQRQINHYVQPAKAYVYHIFVEVPPGASAEQKQAAGKRIQEARQKIVSGTDFKEVARTYSEYAKAEKGGEVGWVPRGTIHPVLDEAIWKLKIGELSAVIENEAGFHLLKVSERKTSSTLPFEEVKEGLRNQLASQKLSARIKETADSIIDKKPLPGPSAFQEALQRNQPIKLLGTAYSGEELQGLTLLWKTMPIKGRETKEWDLGFVNRLALSQAARAKGIEKDPMFTAIYSVTRNALLTRQYIEFLAEQAAPTEKELETYYQENIEQFKLKPAYDARWILLPVERKENPREQHYEHQRVLQRMAEIRKEILAGKLSFAEAARRYSRAANAAQGGLFQKLREPSFPDFDLNVPKLKPGEVSQPIEGVRGIVMFLVEKVYPAEVLPFHQVKDQVLAIMKQQRTKEIEHRLRDKAWADYEASGK